MDGSDAQKRRDLRRLRGYFDEHVKIQKRYQVFLAFCVEEYGQEEVDRTIVLAKDPNRKPRQRRSGVDKVVREGVQGMPNRFMLPDLHDALARAGHEIHPATLSKSLKVLAAEGVLTSEFGKRSGKRAIVWIRGGENKTAA